VPLLAWAALAGVATLACGSVLAATDRLRSGLMVQAAAMETWNVGIPFRDALRKEAAARGQSIDEARLDEACRPERYVARLGPVFTRLEALA